MTNKKILNLYLSLLKGLAGPARPLRVVFDCSNGSVGPILKKIKIKNVRAKIINGRPDGNFPAHGPNPSAAGALRQLSREVKKFKADFGVAFDADGDRAVFVDNQGKPLEPYLAAYLLSLKSRPPFVFDVFIFEALKYAELLSLKSYPSPVGYVFIRQKMKKHRANFGAEYSGHYYHQESYGAESGLISAFKMATLVSQLPYRLSQFKEMLSNKLSTRLFNQPTKNPSQYLTLLERRWRRKTKNIWAIDGLTFEFEKKWITVRPSNTEPLVRIFTGKVI